jgi:hypothetical protein
MSEQRITRLVGLALGALFTCVETAQRAKLNASQRVDGA